MDNCLLSGTVEELLDQLESRADVGWLADLFRSSFGTSPSPQEANSWKNSLPIVLKVLIESDLGGAHCLIEYNLPFDYGRCDLILFGHSDQRLNVVIVELKQWTRVIPYSVEASIVEIPGLGLVPHPSYQVLNYAGKISNFHSVGARSSVSACAFLHNLASAESDAQFLASPGFARLTESAPMFFSNQAHEFVGFVKSKLGSIEKMGDHVEQFSQAEYTQSKQLFDGITKHAKSISDGVAAGVIADGWGLSDTQLLLKEEIKQSLAKKERIVHVVKGEPGSGKTLVAVYALLESMSAHHKVILSFRNSRLMAILRQCLDSSMPGSSGLLKFLGDARDPRKGLVNSNERFDMVIVDEAQRIKETDIPRLLDRSDIFLLLLDEYQMLVPYEGGYRMSYLKSAQDLGFAVKEYELTAAARCRGGKPYQTWVDTLLHGPTDGSARNQQSWREKYDLRVFSNLEEMIEELRGIHETTHYDVCLLASFTESDGKETRVRTSNPELLWAMDEAHYVDFWLKRGSNRLDQCASVYGCQGFERYYAGIIWGRDYCWRDGKWTVPKNNTITDGIGSRGHRLVDLAKKSDPRTLELLFNRYRIMLTRGIFGTYVFAEDEETRDHLLEVGRFKSKTQV